MRKLLSPKIVIALLVMASVVLVAAPTASASYRKCGAPQPLSRYYIHSLTATNISCDAARRLAIRVSTSGACRKGKKSCSASGFWCSYHLVCSAGYCMSDRYSCTSRDGSKRVHWGYQA